MFNTILLTIIVLGLVITFHEVGHFTAAKMAGVYVHEFAIGMGPKIFTKQYKETKYSLRAIPIGGYVHMAGEDPNDIGHPRGLNTKGKLTRAFISVAGALMNFVLAALLFIIVIYFQGVPDGTATIGEIFVDTPAASAGLQVGDVLVNINGTAIQDWDGVTSAIKPYPGENLLVVVQRGTEILNFEITAGTDETTGEGFIGISPKLEAGSIFTAITNGLSHTFKMIRFIILAFIAMFTKSSGLAQGAGPLGIVQMVGEVSQTGILNTISFTALLSINVGIFNLLPIPPLDGSRVLLIGVEAIRGKPIDPKRENLIYMIGFALMIVFAIFITYQDILRLNL